MSLYTVEQIELIRRLRLTGITTAQIVEAFQIFDRLDQELSLARADLSHVSSALLPHMLASAHVHPFVSTSTTPIFNCADALSTAVNGSSPQAPKSAYSAIRTSSPTISQFVDSMPTMIDCYGAGSALWPPASTADDCPSPKIKASRLSDCEQRSSTSVRASLEKLERLEPEIMNEINELMSREESAILEMREYVTAHQLRQQAIAQMCGISQPYVSKFLNGSYRDLSERVRRLIFHWYVKSKKESPDYVRVMVNTGEPAQLKRERFIFKPVHVRLLEKFFQQDQYPNMAKREEICVTLNNSFMVHKGGILDEKEVVSEHVVGTWFSNRRKEKKRKDFRQMRLHSTSSNQRSLLNQFLSNVRQSAAEQIQPAITVDDDNMDDDNDDYADKTLDKEDDIEPSSSEDDSKIAITVPNNDAKTPGGGGGDSYSEGVLQHQLDAVNNSVYALLNPY